MHSFDCNRDYPLVTFNENGDNPVPSFDCNMDYPMATFNENGDNPVATFVNPICVIKFTQIFAKTRRRILLKKKNIALFPDYKKINKKIHWKIKIT